MKRPRLSVLPSFVWSVWRSREKKVVLYVCTPAFNFFSLAVTPIHLSVWFIFTPSTHTIQKASKNNSGLNIFAMDIAFYSTSSSTLLNLFLTETKCIIVILVFHQRVRGVQRDSSMFHPPNSFWLES